MAPQLSYIGGGVITHGLEHSTRLRSQNDTQGHCDIISARCRSTLLRLAEQRATTHLFEHITKTQELGDNFRDLGDGRGILECDEDFLVKGAFGWSRPRLRRCCSHTDNTVATFASPLLNSTGCRFEPAPATAPM